MAVVTATALVTLWLASVPEWYGFQITVVAIAVWLPTILMGIVRLAVAGNAGLSASMTLTV